MDQEDANTSREESLTETNKQPAVPSENNAGAKQTAVQESRTLLSQDYERQLRDTFFYHNTSLEDNFLYAEAVASDNSNASGDQSNESDDSGSVEFIESKKRHIDIDSDDSSEVEVDEPLPFPHSSFVERLFSFGDAKKRKVDMVEQSIQTDNQNDSIPWDAECVICFDSMKPEEAIVRLPCRHFYHFSCIGHYFNTKMREIRPQYECPMCREKYKGEWRLPESRNMRHEPPLSDQLGIYQDVISRTRQRRSNSSALGGRTRHSTRRGAAHAFDELHAPPFQSPSHHSSHGSSALLSQDNGYQHSSNVQEPISRARNISSSILPSPVSSQPSSTQRQYLSSVSPILEDPLTQSIMGNAPSRPQLFPSHHRGPNEQPPPCEYPSYLIESSRSEVSLSRIVMPMDPVLAPEGGMPHRPSFAVSNSLAAGNALGAEPWPFQSPVSHFLGHQRHAYQHSSSRDPASLDSGAARDFHSAQSPRPSSNRTHAHSLAAYPYLVYSSPLSSSSHGAQPTPRAPDSDQPRHIFSRPEVPPLPLPMSSSSSSVSVSTSLYPSLEADEPDLLFGASYFCDENGMGGF